MLCNLVHFVSMLRKQQEFRQYRLKAGKIYGVPNFDVLWFLIQPLFCLVSL